MTELDLLQAAGGWHRARHGQEDIVPTPVIDVFVAPLANREDMAGMPGGARKIKPIIDSIPNY